MKQLKDYLHLYLGCEFIWNNGLIDYKKTLTADWIDNILQGHFNIKNCKPILRTTQSMTSDEWNNAPRGSVNIERTGVFYTPDCVAYLLSLHIDLFGLIEAGLAIDATTLP